jgi:hypothetical protein
MTNTNNAAIVVGTARAQPGQIVYGTFDAVELPSGGFDQFPVIIAQGSLPGPTLWITASIHGAEYTGMAVAHRLVTPELVNRMRGTLVVIPTLNPAGMRTGQRSPYYANGQDPNRLFPAPANIAKLNATDAPTAPLELAYKRLFAVIATTANGLIDLHNFSIGSLPFAFRDPLFYRDSRERVAMQKLQETVGMMLAAFGHTVVNEFVSAEYLKKNLHRSVSGATFNTAHIPAFTVELGGYMSVDLAIVYAALAGIRNVMRVMGLLTDPAEPISGIRVLNPGFPVRRMMYPYAPQSGIVQYLVKSGDAVTIGSPVVRLVDVYGRPIGENNGYIHSEYDGYVLGLSVGAVCYQNDPLISMLVRDDADLVLPYPL